MEANYVHKDSITLIQDKLVKNELNQIEPQYNALKQQKFNELLKENQELKNQQTEFIKYLEDKIYSIEPKGTGINYNCEYDSEEDYISAMQEQSRLNTLKEILQKYKEIIGDINDKK